MKRKILKRVAIGLGSLIILLVLLVVSVTMIYPAIIRQANRIESPPGIDTMEIVEIDGISQVLHFRGQNVENPVVLVLHGGPGNSDMPMLHNYQFELEHYFTFVRWDQRNAGRTFFLNDPEEVLETLTFERVVRDAYEVTQYIREMLDKEQIIILGHSWGSVLGTSLVQSYPQYFSAYISVGQSVYLIESERLGLEAVLEAVRAEGNSGRIAAAEALRIPQGSFTEYSEDWINFIAGTRALQARYGYAVNPFQVIWLSLHSPFYTFRETMNFFTLDVFYYQSPLMQVLGEFDVRDYGTDYQVPVFYIMGELDRQTSYQLAREFFEEISAPYKAFFSIPNAGHIPMHENTIEYNRVLIEEIRPLIIER